VQNQVESQVIQDFIGNYRKCILLLNLVNYVEQMDSIDTTPTTTNLLKLFGSVNPAIIRYIQEIEKSVPKRFLYQPKASKSDREEGNTHPTVKPTALMQYLCTLVTPVGGTILDPFMGSGSTGKAALKEYFKFIGIDDDSEQGSFNIACERIRYAGKNRLKQLELIRN
jgi:hypothetical protein